MASIDLLRDPYINMIKEIADGVGTISFKEIKNKEIRRARVLGKRLGTGKNFFTVRGNCRSLSLASYNLFCLNVNTVLQQLSPSLQGKFKVINEYIDLRISENKLTIKGCSDKLKPAKKNGEEISDHFWKSLEDSSWSCLELDGISFLTNYFRFNSLKKDGTYKVQFSAHGNSILVDWEGEAKYITDDNIIVATLFLKSTTRKFSGYTQFILKVDDRISKIEMCMGTRSFANCNKGNIISKIVILERLSAEKTFQEVILDSPHLTGSTRFFFNKNNYKISTPENLTITSNDILSKWITDNRVVSAINPSIEGMYDVNYYEAKFKQIKKASFVIVATPFGFQGIFSFSVPGFDDFKNFSGKGANYWLGTSEENKETSIVTFVLHGPYKEDRNFIVRAISLNEKAKVSNRPIALYLNVAFGNNKKINTLVGIAIGMGNEKGNSARLILLTRSKNNFLNRQEKDVFYDYDESIIKGFFEDNNSNSFSNISSDNTISTFEELSEMIASWKLSK